MELHSLTLEVRALKTVTNSKIKDVVRQSMLGRLRPNHFSSEVTRKALKRLNKVVESRSQVMTWDDLLDDPNLGEDIRDYLEENDGSAAKGMKGFGAILDQLDTYRKRRAMLDMSRHIHDVLSKDDDLGEFDEDSLLNDIAEQIGQARSTSVEQETVYTFGVENSNAVTLADETIESPQESHYLTGFEEYDSRNAGIPTHGVMLLAGSTSGGKSVLAQNLADRIALLNGVHALTATLEMTAEQHMNRQLSMITGIDFGRIKRRELSKREKAKLKEAARDYNQRLIDCGGRVSVVSPERGMTMDDVLYLTVPHGADVCIIDYVGLLEDVDVDNQAQALSAAVRKAKVHSKSTHKLYIILVQFDTESNRIRYSRGMKEHADVLWQWNYSDPEVRETHILPVEIAKVRDGELFEMALEERFDIMRVGSPPEGTVLPKKEKKDNDFKGGKGGKAGNKGVSRGRDNARKFLSETVDPIEEKTDKYAIDTPKKKKKKSLLDDEPKKKKKGSKVVSADDIPLKKKKKRTK